MVKSTQSGVDNACEQTDLADHGSDFVFMYDSLLKNQDKLFPKCKKCTNNQSLIVKCTDEKAVLLPDTDRISDADVNLTTTIEKALNCSGLCDRHKSQRCRFFVSTVTKYY